MHNVEFTFNIWSNMKHKKVLKYSLCVCVFQCCTEAVLSQLCEGKTVWTRRDLSQRWRHLWRGWAGLVSRWLLSGTHSRRFTGKRKAVESWQMVNRSTKFSMKQALGWPEAHSCFALLTETGRKLCFFFCHNNIVKVAFASWILNLNHIRILTYLKKTAAKAFKLKSLMSKS